MESGGEERDGGSNRVWDTIHGVTMATADGKGSLSKGQMIEEGGQIGTVG